MNYVEFFYDRVEMLFPREESILYRHRCQHRRHVEMKILLVLTLKMYTVIFVHLLFVCKLIHVNLKPSLCFPQVSVLCIFGSLTADDSCYDYCIFILCKRKN